MVGTGCRFHLSLALTCESQSASLVRHSIPFNWDYLVIVIAEIILHNVMAVTKMERPKLLYQRQRQIIVAREYSPECETAPAYRSAHKEIRIE
jgi:hypothetical protein